MPLGFHRRDALLALFWPELDEEHARDALSAALGFLRRALGTGVVVTRGAEEVGLDRARAWCDAAAFGEHIAAGRHDDALTLYRGDFLRGFHVADAPEFGRW